VAATSKRVRAVVVACLLAVIGIAIYQIGRHLWGNYHRQELETALAQRDFAAAQAALDECFRLRPHDPDLHLLAAQIARRQNKLSEAMRELEMCRANGGSDDAVGFERRLTEIQLGDLTLADDFDRFTTENPDAPETALILEALIQGSLIAGDANRAQAYLDRWEKMRRSDVDQSQAYYWRGLVYQLTKASQDELAAYRRAVELNPQNWQARLALVGEIVDRQSEKAQEHLAILRQQEVDSPLALYYQGRIDHNLGRLDDAARSYDRLLEKSPEHVEGLVSRARVALEQQQTDAAARFLERAEELAPRHRSVLLALIDLHRATGDVRKAEEYQQIVLEIEAELRKKLESAPK